MFLTERRARLALAATDLDPVSGRARLPYRRAEEIFNELTKPLAHPDLTDPGQVAAAPGWTLHDLRHSALTHQFRCRGAAARRAGSRLPC